MSRPSGKWYFMQEFTVPFASPVMMVGLKCTNVPVDGQLSLQVTPPAPLQPYQGPMAPISDPNMTLLEPFPDWPAGVQASVTIYYEQGPTTPPDNADISLLVVITASPELGEPRIATD